MKSWLCLVGVFCPLFAGAQWFNGFWEGPHPADADKKFYVHLQLTDSLPLAKGYWTECGHFLSAFEVNSVQLAEDSISFFVPMWQCRYMGKMTSQNRIAGAFACQEEPPDTVFLTRKPQIVDVLLNPAPGVSAEQFVYHYQAPRQLPDGLATGAASTHADTLFVDSLFSATGRGEFGRINALLVAREHELIGEMYFYGYQPGDLHPLESTTKSITSLLVGIAIEQGAIPPVNTQVVQWYPQLQRNSPIAAESLTLKHLLTMSSGFAPREQALFGSNNRIAFALNRPMDTLPGKVFRYDGGNTELLGGILKQSTGLFADEFAARYLFGPLQITDWNWEKHRQDGYPSMAGALHLRPRDMAKIGLLVLHNGMYNNQQVVEPHWIQASTTAQIATHIDGDEYGYQWWISHLHSGNSVYKTIWANGIGSQFIFVVPRLQLVVVCTGHNYQQDAWAFVNGLAQYLYLLK